jgi:hypothetical protein
MLNPFISMKIAFKRQGGFKMIKRMSIFFFFSILFVCCFVQVSMAQENDVEIYGIKAVPDSPLTYFYLPGHEEDLAQIAGFSYEEATILNIDGVPTKVATGTVTVTFINPPLNLTSPFIYATITETIPGILDISGYMVASTYTNSASTGEVTGSWTGSIKGTGDLLGWYGLITSWGTANFLPVGPAGSMNQIWRVRFGY